MQHDHPPKQGVLFKPQHALQGIDDRLRVLAWETAADTACAQLGVEEHNLPRVVTLEIGQHISQRRSVVGQSARTPTQLSLAVDLMHNIAHTGVIRHLLVSGKNLLPSAWASSDANASRQYGDLRPTRL